MLSKDTTVAGRFVMERRPLPLQTPLLYAGILTALLYGLMNVVTPALYPGYDWTSQTVSELSAIDAPTRSFWGVLGVLYGLLMLAFGWGVWRSDPNSKALRVAGASLLLAAFSGFYWPPMHRREVLEAGGASLTDTLHVAWTMGWAVLTVIAMIAGAMSFGRRFCIFTAITIVALIGAGFVAGSQSPAMDANLPTPGLGIWQRVNITAYLVWLATFSVALLHRPASRRAERMAEYLRDNAESQVHGFVAPGWEGVRKAFVENFRIRNELGGACCIYHDGEKVVDLWGGIRNPETGDPWEEDTMVIVYSTTKGMAAMTLALAHSRGLLDYDEKVYAYWPEFAQNGKRDVTVRQLLAHQAGLHAFHEKVDRKTVADLDRLAAIMVRERPEWPPGERQSYHAISLGFYEGELMRRVDPKHRSLGQYFREEIANPLELEFYIGLPASVPDSKLAVLDQQSPLKAILALPAPLRRVSLNPWSHMFRAIMVNPGSMVVLDPKTIYARELEVPSGGGVGTARAIARAYSAFATDGRELGLKPVTLRELMAPAIPSAHGFFDEGLRGEMLFSLGFTKSSPSWSFGHVGAFGSPGAGGSLGYADPATGLAYAYVTNRMGTVDGDPRDIALREAIPELPVREVATANPQGSSRK
jgi:CubicO group peptidase (beta-lactamase class C family)